MNNFNDFFSYHMKTKHSYFSIRNFPNRLDWDNQPSAFKSYPKNFKKIELDTEKENHSFLYYIAGISAKKTYPGVEYYLRMNPSAGALYPNEIYFQSRGNSDFEDGIYHFDIVSSSVTLLTNMENDGLEPYFDLEYKFEGFIFLLSSIYYRSSWKYKNRALRYCLLDAGHILGSMEASSYLHEKDFKIVYDFEKEKLNELFSFDNQEFFTASSFLGELSKEKVEKVNLEIPRVDGSIYFEKNDLIEEAYKDSLLIKAPLLQTSKPTFSYNKEVLKEIIFKRRSVREFTKQAMLKKEFETILNMISQCITSDCDEDIDIYCVINRVKDMKLGVLKNGQYLKNGDYVRQAGYLCLEQDLGSSSSVTFFLTSKGKNYQELYQKAGLIGHRLYLMSNYLGYECSGIGAYYDDEVCEFLDEYSQVLYALAIGK